ncbi:DUF1501 domain-containing protein [Sulfitobacter sp. LCG007]
MSDRYSRRAFLARSGIIGCSLAASPLLTPVSVAAAPWDTRLVVIILRGAMDGLDVLRPQGDPTWRSLRPSLSAGTAGLDLDGFFAMHPALSGLMPLWQAGELGFVNAVSTPYRDKRSHFDGQDILEAGTRELAPGVRDGWLNRMLQAVPGAGVETAYAVGDNDLRLLSGDARVSNWSPQTDFVLSPQAARLMAMITEADPVMHAALEQADTLARSTRMERGGAERLNGAHRRIAEFVGQRLRGDGRVAGFSINGWDTHYNQSRIIDGALLRLADAILVLRDTLTAPVWNKTAVIALTEFGRTARENGSGGTDHGTGGLMLMAGGAIRGGRVHGRWPGLDEADLYERRDLMPTSDVRAHAGWILRGVTGLDRATLERTVFPGVDMGRDPVLLR